MEDLPDKNSYIVNLELSICLEAGEPCDIKKVVLENILLPKLPCDYNTDFKFPGKIF